VNGQTQGETMPKIYGAGMAVMGMNAVAPFQSRDQNIVSPEKLPLIGKI